MGSDKMVLARLFAYGDSNRYRTGPNYEQLPVNRPINEVHNYNKDGRCATGTTETSRSTRRTATAEQADLQRYRDPSWFVDGGEIVRAAYEAHTDDDDFIQPGALYREVMSPADRDHLAGNIVSALSQGVERFIQERAGRTRAGFTKSCSARSLSATYVPTVNRRGQDHRQAA